MSTMIAPVCIDCGKPHFGRKNVEEEKLKSEWREEIRKWPQMDALGSADFWLKKIAERETESREKMIEEIGKTKKNKKLQD